MKVNLKHDVMLEGERHRVIGQICKYTQVICLTVIITKRTFRTFHITIETVDPIENGTVPSYVILHEPGIILPA